MNRDQLEQELLAAATRISDDIDWDDPETLDQDLEALARQSHEALVYEDDHE